MTIMLKKISPKSLKCQNIGDGFSLFGRVNMARTTQTQLGTSIQLFGLLRAKTDSGEVYEGISCYLPSGYDNLFAGQLEQAQNQSKTASIEICHHFKKQKAENPMGCEWIMTSLSKNSGGMEALDEIEKNSLPAPTVLSLTDETKAKKTAKK